LYEISDRGISRYTALHVAKISHIRVTVLTKRLSHVVCDMANNARKL